MSLKEKQIDELKHSNKKLRERVTEAREKNEFLARKEKNIDELIRENEQFRKRKSGAGKSQEYEQLRKRKNSRLRH